MLIQIDTREKQRAIKKIVKTFDDNNIAHISSKLYVGDYQNVDNPRIFVDRKQSLLELCQNVCQDHKRFIEEIKRANDCGFVLIFLVEHGYGIKHLADVRSWVNPRLKQSPLAVSGERLYRILCALNVNYGVEFQFCEKKDTGMRILELLA